MQRALSAAVLLCMCIASAANAQGTAPDEEFVPWTGQSEAPAQTAAPAPAQAPAAKKVPPPVAPRSEDEEEKDSSESEWAPLPGSSATTAEPEAPVTEAPLPAPPPPPTVAAPPPSQKAEPPARPTTHVFRKPTPQEFNRVSLYGASTLGKLKPAAGFYLGFPLVGLKVGFGLLDRLDVGVGFDSFYGAMNEPRAFTKFRIAGDSHYAVAAVLEGGAAFFAQDPQSDTRGARWLTGRRNYNVEGGLVGSYQGDSVQAARLFLDARYHLSMDTQPFTENPLGGVPPPVVYGSNVIVRMGAEMPFSPSTSFLFIFGFDLHGRVDVDSAFMPVVSVGLVTGL